jgi:hypothetical protein
LILPTSCRCAAAAAAVAAAAAGISVCVGVRRRSHRHCHGGNLAVIVAASAAIAAAIGGGRTRMIASKILLAHFLSQKSRQYIWPAPAKFCWRAPENTYHHSRTQKMAVKALDIILLYVEKYQFQHGRNHFFSKGLMHGMVVVTLAGFFSGDCDHWAIFRWGSGILKLNLVRLTEFKMVM